MRCAVLGDPVEHSLSPVLHRAAYDELGLDWSYDAVRVPAGGLAAFLAGLAGREGRCGRDGDWRGLSLTMPLKREVMALDLGAAREATERARLAGAANTVVLAEGRVSLDNTDLPGAAAAVRERWDGPVTEVSVLGAGATAASVGLAMCDLGARSVTLLARDPGRAAETAAVISRHPAAPTVRVAPLDDPLEDPAPLTGQVLVSTVPARAQGKALVARWADVPVVFEVLYDPWPTPLAAAATARGQVLVGGLDLLVHQGALQVTLFTGRPAPLARMRAAGEAALVARAARAGGSMS